LEETYINREEREKMYNFIICL